MQNNKENEQVQENKNSKILFGILFSAVCFLFIGIALFTNGTCDSGDSINHYLLSYYSWKHPVLFLDLWNKPFFTLVSSPFAQFGFTGMKIFNAICGCISALMVYRIANFYSPKNKRFALILFIGSAFHFVVLNSGLTEPLFDCLLITSIYFYLAERKITSAFCISLLPFVRQEGYLIIAFFLIYFILKKEFRPLIYLFAGHLIVTLAGIVHYGDLLWIFKNNPNAFWGHYGHGGWFDYFFKLAYIFGKPIYFFIAIGLILTVIRFFKNEKKWFFLMDSKMLPAYIFIMVVVAHALFWRFGMFKSFGMERNIITVYSCGIIVAFIGSIGLFNILKIKNENLIFKIGFTALILFYPFYPAEQKVHLKQDLSLLQDQLLVKDACKDILPIMKDCKIYSSHPNVVTELNLDPLDSIHYRSIYQMPWRGKKDKCIVVWDSWLAVIESGVKYEDMQTDSTLTLFKEYSGEKNKIAVFISK